MKQVSVVLFCLLFAFSSNVSAMGGKKVSGGSRDIASERDIASFEHESKGVPQLITYEELKSLSPESRAKYIKGVRAMIVELAAKGGSDYPIFAGRKSLQETYSLLEALLPAAHAQRENNGTKASEIKPRYLRRQLVDNMEKWTCDSDQAYFDYAVGTCVHKDGKRATLLSNCPAGYHAAYMKASLASRAFGNPSNKYCVPSGSWTQLATKRKNELKVETGADSAASYFRTRLVRSLRGGQEQASGDEIALGDTPTKKPTPPHLTTPVKDAFKAGYTCNSINGKVQYNQYVGTCVSKRTSRDQKCPATDWQPIYLVRAGWTKNYKEYYCVTPASWAQLSSKRQEDLTEAMGVNEASESDRVQAASGKGRKSYASVTVTLPEAKPATSGTAQTFSAVSEGTPNDDPATPEVERSPAEEIVQGDAPCAGISAMACGDNSQKAEKRKAASDWWKKNSNVCVFGGNISNFSSEDYKEKTCSSVYSFSKPRLSCKEGVICNPIVFGAKSDGSAYCSTKYEEATADCNSQAGEKGSNAWLEKNAGNVKTEWNKLRAGMSQACGTNAVREYFCGECNIMMERLASLRLLALEKGGDGLCHAPLVAHESATKAVKPKTGPAEEKAAQ